MTTDDRDMGDDNALAAEYVLGLLTEAETKAFETRLNAEPDLRALVARWTEDLSSLTDNIPEVAPPPSVAAALDARLFPERKQNFISRLGLLPALIGGFVAALLVVWVTSQGLLEPDPFVGNRYATQIMAGDQSLVVEATFDPASGTLLLDRQSGGAREGRVLELWLIVGSDPPKSLGVLPSEVSMTLVVDAALISGFVGGTLALSDEPPGGSPTGAPTGDVLAAGVLTEI